MKPRHLILIVLLGICLITVAPTSEKAGQADNGEAVRELAEDVKVIPPQEVKSEPEASHAKVEPASFTREAEELKRH